MIAYLDSSVVLRIVLGEPEPLPEWPDLENGISSALLRVECYRVLERLWHGGSIETEAVETKRREVETILSRLEVLPVHDEVLRLAAEPLPTHLPTLDALHLATALLYRRSPEARDEHVVFATHDKLLGKAARAMHFDVRGV